jgi:hypothetical protein
MKMVKSQELKIKEELKSIELGALTKYYISG